MTVKIRLEPSPGCGAPPAFRLRPGDILDGILEWELQEVLANVNGWIAANWMGWGCSNWGWLFGCCCLVRFVKNDLLFREPLAVHVEKMSQVMKTASMTLSVSRKVKSKGYGETSETVVKVRLIVVPTDKKQANNALVASREAREARRRSVQLSRLAMRSGGDEIPVAKDKEESKILIPQDESSRHLWVVRDEGSASGIESDSVKSGGLDEVRRKK